MAFCEWLGLAASRQSERLAPGDRSDPRCGIRSSQLLGMPPGADERLLRGVLGGVGVENTPRLAEGDRVEVLPVKRLVGWTRLRGVGVLR